MKFILMVEGETEKKAVGKFLQDWLNARLTHRVSVYPDMLEGSGEYVKGVAKKANLHLSSPKSDIIAVIGLLDLYNVALPIPSHRKTVDERVQWATDSLEKQVSHDRFRQFFAVHETEAWLLSDTAIFPPGLKLPDYKTPESVNSHEPPGMLLSNLYKTRLKASEKQGYKKVAHGIDLFRKLNADTAYAKCPNLKLMLDEMLTMAQEAGLA